MPNWTFIYKNTKKKVDLLNNIEKLLQSQTYHESYLHVTPTRKSNQTNLELRHILMA